MANYNALFEIDQNLSLITGALINSLLKSQLNLKRYHLVNSATILICTLWAKNKNKVCAAYNN